MFGKFRLPVLVSANHMEEVWDLLAQARAILIIDREVIAKQQALLEKYSALVEELIKHGQ